MVEPPTCQQPHPPIWMAAGSPSSICRVAARGYNLILDQFAGFEVIAERIALYKAECAARVGLAPFAPGKQGGRPSDPLGIALARDMNVVDSRAEKDAALARNRQFHERILSVARWPDQAGGSHILAYDHAPEEVEAASLVGTPDEITAKLETLRRAGVEYVIMSCGGSRESLRRFAHEIMPAFADEPAKAGTAAT